MAFYVIILISGDFMYSNELICDILDYLDININRKISIDELAIRFSYNKFYIMKLFKKEIGIPLIIYINYIRIFNSIKSIQNSNDSFTKIALCNGFYSLEYFSETFNKVMGVSPRVFKNYYVYRYKLTNNELNILSSRWIYIQELIDKVNRYKKNKKQKRVTKKIKKTRIRNKLFQKIKKILNFIKKRIIKIICFIKKTHWGTSILYNI